MKRKWAWLVVVLGVVVLGLVALGILLYYYHSTTPHKEEAVVLNKTYDYIIGSTNILLHIIAHYYFPFADSNMGNYTYKWLIQSSLIWGPNDPSLSEFYF